MTQAAGQAAPPQQPVRDAGLDGLQTARLKLRRFTLDDEALLLTLNRSPAVMRYLEGPMNAETNRRQLHERILPYYAEHSGLGAWATLERSTGRCVGLHLLNHIRGESLIQVGYRLFEADWGKGYATEMGIALLRYGYVDLGLPSIVAITHVDNRASQQVLLKCGLHRQGERAFAHPFYAPYGAMPYFERGARDWLADHGN